MNSICTKLFVLLLGVLGVNGSPHFVHITPQNSCVSFSVGQGTGCQWMCNYCATTLGTPNYYFTDSVCTYKDVGCVGNPISGITYTCCTT